MWIYLVSFLPWRTIGLTPEENSMVMLGVSKALRAAMKKRELRRVIQSLVTSVLISESFSPNSLATERIERVSGALVSQMIEPSTERAKRAASLVVRMASSWSRSRVISLSLGIRA